MVLASSRQRRFGIGTRSQAAQLLPKLATGIEGFDALSRGGLPRHRTRHLIKLGSLIREHRPRCLVIDPLTAIAKASSLGAGRTVANRIIYMAKDAGITALVTALSEADEPQAESTDLQISTIADTWIHLSYQVRGGERNRALTIVKSRG